MKKMTASEIRKTWLEYFVAHDHFELESASLIPINDSSLLWINSGVATLKNYFSGKTNPPHANLTNSQKCIRTNDIFNVGVTSRHHTFFEMLGNFSIGGYFKEHAIDLAYDLLINRFEMDVNKLYFTVYEEDDVAYKKWLSFKTIKPSHIIKCNRDRNFWDVGSGPCGPCTEIYYDRGPKYDPHNIGEKLFYEDVENDRYVEIWNIVFSEFNNDGNNNYKPLDRKNIDTGAGLERIACISQDVPTNFDTDLFQNIILTVQKYAKRPYDMQAYFTHDPEKLRVNLAYKVIADHARTSVFAIADGAIPSNKDRGYILRRLIRRLVIMLHKLEISSNILTVVAQATIDTMSVYYTYLNQHAKRIFDVLNKEYEIFKKTLDQGFKLYKEAARSKRLDGQTVFKLVETFGFPIELIKELAAEDILDIDIIKFEELFREHQRISNARSNEIAMSAQNGELLQLNTPFKFLYDKNDIKAKIVKLYNDNFNTVDVLNESGYVVFDASCLYATSGGQMCDTGWIDKSLVIHDVIKGPNLQHIHHVENAYDLRINTEHTLTYYDQRRQSLTKNHSAEHLIHAALTKLVDKNIRQEGAHKAPDKLSFDFQYHEKLSPEKLKEIETHINGVIKKGIKTQVLELSLDEAQAVGAKAYFEDVYKKIKGKLRVVKMGDESCELCGGTHVQNTKDIEVFKITSFNSRAAGSWRIEAITSFKTLEKAIAYKIIALNQEIKLIRTSKLSNQALDKLINAIDWDSKDMDYLDKVLAEIKAIYRELKVESDKQNNREQTLEIKTSLKKETAPVIFKVFHDFDNRNLFNALTELINEEPQKVFVVFNVVANKVQYMLATNEVNKQYNLNQNIKVINTLTNGKGGGKPNFVQGGCTDFMDIDKLIETTKGSF